MEHITETEFIKREISVWGEDYIFELVEKGYEPQLIISATDESAKWVWLLPCGSRIPVL